jgi:hypothetical protein
MKPFNLEEALAGKPVITRDGKEARMIYQSLVNEKPLLCSVYLTDKESYISYCSDGKQYSNATCSNDLFMKPEKQTFWMFISNQQQQKFNGVFFRLSSVTFNSEKDAKDSPWNTDKDYKLTSFEAEV